jgi:alkylation response protein AidB-like acyl-CoA dehydrogenase
MKKFGSYVPFAEPYWYQGFPSPYYTQEHCEYREKCRNFVENDIKPYAEDWIAKKEYPMSLHEKLYQRGISGIVYPESVGGSKRAAGEYFFELIRIDEFSRIGGGHILGQEAINSMALPPIINFGRQFFFLFSLFFYRFAIRKQRAERDGGASGSRREKVVLFGHFGALCWIRRGRHQNHRPA